MAEATEVLRRTPNTLQELLDELSEPWVRGTEGPETFSAFDVVGHLIDGEETDWMPRARIILARGPDTRFETYDRFRHRARNVRRTLPSLLDEFARLRSANLEVLESWGLSETQLDLTGFHPTFGAVTLHRSDRACHGETVHGRRGAVGAVHARTDRPRTAAPLIGDNARVARCRAGAGHR